MKILFIIPSAIMLGNGDPQERFLQTLHTIDSIKSRVLDADIWLCESSTEPLKEWMKPFLKSVKIINFSNDTRVHQIKDQVKVFKMPVTKDIRPFYENGAIKNLTESYVINQALSLVNPSDYTRIFKISGRYFLTDIFDLKSHNVYGKMVLKPKKNSKIGKTHAGGDYYRYCISWNFCTSIFEDMRQSFINIEKYVINQYDSGRLGDIEHGLDLFISQNLIHEIYENGIIGRVNNKSVHVD